MPSKSRRWQTQIEIRRNVGSGPNEIDNDWPIEPDETVYVYGETIDQLREAAKTYLLSRKLVWFSNGGDHFVGRVEYHRLKTPSQEKTDDAGWWRLEIQLINGRMSENVDEDKFDSLEEAVDNFAESALIPEKGPDYRSKAIVGNDLRLPLLEKILREAEEHPINDLIQRGWHLIALEYKGELSITGELANRKAIFVMGHPEAQAGLLTLDSKHYKKRFFGIK
jgi:hypothetical protein